ncbi:hypothetical protein TNCV_1299281 [Trichonephila clavipes]|nr:hypothetical protein TNCV_1299281 [Trichonephila clavipes]
MRSSKPIVVSYAAAIRDDLILIDVTAGHIMLTWWRISFRGRNRTNGKINVFSDINPIEHVWDSLEDELLAANHFHKLSKNWKELFWESGDRIPQLVINSLIDSISQGVQRCWSSVETIPLTETDFL